MRLLPADAVLALYQVALVIVWIPALPHTAALAMIALHAALILLMWRIARTPGRGAGVSALRHLFPVVWLAAAWQELGLHWAVVGSRANDAALLALETQLFGVNLAGTWAAGAPAWLGSLMDTAYLAYYPLVVAVPVIVGLRGRRGGRRDIALRLVATYTTCFLVYAVFPAVGPRAAGLAAPRGGALLAVAEALRSAGDATGTAFPSSHVAGAATAAFLAWRYGPPWLAWPATLVALLIVPATVYTGNHFVLDALAGVVLAGLVQTIMVPLATRSLPVAVSATELPRTAPEGA